MTARKFDFAGFSTDEIDKASKPAEGGQTILGGDYIGRIVDVEDVEFAGQGAHKGYPALKIQFLITESGTGEGEGAKLYAFRVPMFTRFNNAKKSPAFQFFQLIKALGLEAGEGLEFPSNEELLGQDIGLKVGYQRPRNNAKNYKADEKIYNEILGFFPAEQGLSDTVIPHPTNIDGSSGGGFSSAPAQAASGDTTNPWSV